MTYKTDIINSAVQDMLAQGFRVFLAARGDYGFYTDTSGSRVVSFGFDIVNLTFSGNYKTSRPYETGTGWRLADGSYSDMFNEYPPQWALKGAAFKHSTLEQHLKTYQDSSKYHEVEKAPA